jgi:2-(1,2-epoxy-1,2-dihydrophenyl)acetyl-CoA isomerase
MSAGDSPHSGGLVVEMHGGVQRVQLNRPQARNAIDVDTAHALTALFRDANTDHRVRAILLIGTGRDYCTGGDANVPASSSDSDTPAPSLMDYRFGTHLFQQLFAALWEIEKPVVSAVNGTVAGAGWMLALLADLVVAAEGARWTHVFTKRGMIPHAGDPFFLPRVLPFHFLNEVALLGDTVRSEDLHRVGAVNRLVPADQVEAVATELAQRLATGPTRSLGQAKRLYRRSSETDMRTAFNEETAAATMLTTTHDRSEGVRSFLEGRPAEFTGN